MTHPPARPQWPAPISGDLTSVCLRLKSSSRCALYACTSRSASSLACFSRSVRAATGGDSPGPRQHLSKRERLRWQSTRSMEDHVPGPYLCGLWRPRPGPPFRTQAGAGCRLDQLEPPSTSSGQSTGKPCVYLGSSGRRDSLQADNAGFPGPGHEESVPATEQVLVSMKGMSSGELGTGNFFC